MKRRIIYCLILVGCFILLGFCGYLQFGRQSQIVTSYKSGHGKTTTLILNVNANKLFLTDQDAYDILYGTCTNYGDMARRDEITVYLYANSYSFLHGNPYCMGVYQSDDSLKYNTRDNAEKFWLEMLPAPWWLGPHSCGPEQFLRVVNRSCLLLLSHALVSLLNCTHMQIRTIHMYVPDLHPHTALYCSCS